MPERKNWENLNVFYLISNTTSPFGKSDDVTSLNEPTNFIPNRYADAARLVSHFTRAHLMTVFGLRHSSLKKIVWEKIQIPDDYCPDTLELININIRRPEQCIVMSKHWGLSNRTLHWPCLFHVLVCIMEDKTVEIHDHTITKVQ